MAGFSIPYIPLTDEEKQECIAVMRKGNHLMKAWAEDFFGKKNCASRLRKGLFRWVDNGKKQEEVAKKLGGDENLELLDPQEVGIPQPVFEAMLEVRNVEAKMMFGHVRMAIKLARRYAWALDLTYLDFDDLILEGLVALQDAIYSYDRNDANFITYAYSSIKWRLRRKINQATDFGGFTKTGLKLLERYNATRQKLEKDFGGQVSMGTIILAMKIDHDDIRHLKSLLQRSVRASTMSGDEDGNPYENLGVNPGTQEIDIKLLIESLHKQGKTDVQREIVIAAAKGEISPEEASRKVQVGEGVRKYKERNELILMAMTSPAEVWNQAVKKAKLTPIQQELVTAAISGEKHFQSRIANSYINPDTNKPYTRMAITYMLRRAYVAIETNLRKLEVAA